MFRNCMSYIVFHHWIIVPPLLAVFVVAIIASPLLCSNLHAHRRGHSAHPTPTPEAMRRERVLAQRNGVGRAATRAEHDVVKGGGDNPHVSLLATRFRVWCLIIALLLRKAGSRLVQTDCTVYNVFHHRIIVPPLFSMSAAANIASPLQCLTCIVGKPSARTCPTPDAVRRERLVLAVGSARNARWRDDR